MSEVDPPFPHGRGEPPLWRLHSDAINSSFLLDAVRGRRVRSALKTDLFDEAVTAGVVPAMRKAAESITAIDLSPEVVERARQRHPDVATIRGDVRRLPFGDASFDLVVSLSTLDHLARVDEIRLALAELARVMAPGGLLLLTLDNRANPVIALRQLLPATPLRRAGLVAYPVGATVGPRRLDRLVRGAAFTPRRRQALMHCPRLPAVALARAIERASLPRRRFLRAAAGFEALGRLPTRYLTGYFAAVVAERGQAGSAQN
jgi:SAM-dependent methyltransferase